MLAFSFVMFQTRMVRSRLLEAKNLQLSTVRSSTLSDAGKISDKINIHETKTIKWSSLLIIKVEPCQIQNVFLMTHLDSSYSTQNKIDYR